MFTTVKILFNNFVSFETLLSNIRETLFESRKMRVIKEESIEEDGVEGIIGKF
jgi:hypothetical protein